MYFFRCAFVLLCHRHCWVLHCFQTVRPSVPRGCYHQVLQGISPTGIYSLGQRWTRFWNWRWKITSRPNCSKMAEAYTLTARHWILPRFFVCIQASGTMCHWPGLGKDFREASVINLYFGSFSTSRIYTGRLLGDMMVGDVCDVMFAVVHCIFRFEM